MSDRPTFAQIVATAKRQTPFGVLQEADRKGLIKRGIQMNLSAIDILTTLDQVPARHPIIRGIE